MAFFYCPIFGPEERLSMGLSGIGSQKKEIFIVGSRSTRSDGMAVRG
jgi:hypothetical protein